MNGDLWEVTYSPDQKDSSGLLFYSKTKLEKKPQPSTVPAPALSKQDKDELEKQVQAVKNQGAKEGWSTLEIIGMVVLIAFAIALLIAAAVFVASAITAAIAGLGGAVGAAGTGQISLMAALAALFAFNPATVAAEAQTKGQEKEKGMLDGAIGWFKSWF